MSLPRVDEATPAAGLTPPAPGHVQVVPLGGVGEIGKNMWCVRTPGGIIVLDCGFGFPTEEMHGVDLVLPDYTYLREHADEVRGVFLSHGHEDHIGGVPYLLQQLKVPVYATPLTLSLVEGKLAEFGLLGEVELHRLTARSSVQVADMTVEFIHVCHSIADAVAIAVHTPAGTLLYTGDYKFDPTPIDGELTDYYKLSQLGESGLLLLMADSTNVTKKGFTPSEATVAPVLDKAFGEAPGRIIVTTFASNIHRVQQILTAAANHDRHVALLGRSMINVTQRANALGYLRFPEGLLVDIDATKDLPPEKVVILATGSQGEPMAALSRFTTSEIKGVSVSEGDTVLISAIPIPGNERAVGRIINELMLKGANVIYESVQHGTHVSGHASEEEIKQMINLTRPEFFVPMHGEPRHLLRHAALAQKLGVPGDHVAVLQNGDVLDVSRSAGLQIVNRVPSGPVLVDGNVLYDVGRALLRDRQRLAADGVVVTVVTLDGALNLLDGPAIESKGFIYTQSDGSMLLDEGKRRVVEVLDSFRERGLTDRDRLKRQIVETLSRYFNEQTRRKPVQLVILQEAPARAPSPVPQA
ncbi:MAG TPA: ribonuclease J [Oscillatoriaceae cyanobacterium]